VRNKNHVVTHDFVCCQNSFQGDFRSTHLEHCFQRAAVEQGSRVALSIAYFQSPSPAMLAMRLLTKPRKQYSLCDQELMGKKKIDLFFCGKK